MASYPAWPASLPQAPLLQSLSGGVQDNRVSFQPESGPPIERPRMTATVEIWTIALPPMTKAQLATFEAFWRVDLAMGTRAFAWRHPVTGAVGRWKIMGGQPPYRISAVTTEDFSVDFQAMQLPGAAWFAPYLPAGTLLVPDLVLDFAAQVYGIEGVRKTFADIVTFSRAGSANYVDKAGFTQSAGPDVPRFDHQAGTLTPLGLLMKSADGDAATIGPARWPLGLFAASGSMLVICRSQQTTAPSLRYVFGATGATPANERIDTHVVTTVTNFRAVASGASQAALSLGTYTAGNRIRIASAFAANDFRASRDGAAALSDAAGTFPVVDRAGIGVSETEVRIEKVICWNQALTSAQLQALSA